MLRTFYQTLQTGNHQFRFVLFLFQFQMAVSFLFIETRLNHFWFHWHFRNVSSKQSTNYRQSALQTAKKENTDRIPFTLTFHPHNHAVKSVVSSCTGTQKKETLTNCVITPCMVMKTIGIPSCTGTPGQPR